MKLVLEITSQVGQQLVEAAKRLNISPEDLATAAVRDFVAGADEEFARAAARVLEKNRGLYRRLT